MDYKVVWSESAADDFEKILEYLKANWGEGTEERFKAKLVARLNLLSTYPELHPPSSIDPRYRRSVLTRQVSIIYSVGESTIYIVRLFDNRQDPESFKP